MRKTGAILGCALVMAGCGGNAHPPAPSTVATAASPTTVRVDPATLDPRRSALVEILTCRNRAFLARTGAEQRAALASIDGVACDAVPAGAPQRCTIAPALRVGNADIRWFVIGTAGQDLTPIVLPAPPEAFRNALPAGSGALSQGTDLGDTTVQCAHTDRALAKGAITGTVQRGGNEDTAMRVCAFELAEGVSTCIRTAPGERDFRIDLPRGDYLVYAIPVDARDTRVGYTDCDTAELDAPCAHQLKVVAVRAGDTTLGVDPTDVRTLDDAADWPSPPPSE